MRAWHIVWPGRAEWHVRPTQLLLLLAMILAAGLLAGYVQLLNDSVARGVQSRADQQLSATKPRPPSRAAR